MLVAERPRLATAPARAVCATPGCGTVLSAYNDDPDRLCAACRRRISDEGEKSATPLLDLDRLIAGILLSHDALHPGEPVNLRLELSALGLEVDSWRVGLCVRHLARRHGLVARGERGRPGYMVVEWERRYRQVTGFGGGVMERDPGSGKWRGLLPDLLPQTKGRGEVAPGQLSLLGSDEPTATEMSEPTT